MRAMQIIEWGKPLETREYPDPEPKGEEVLLRVEAPVFAIATSISGTGILIWATNGGFRWNRAACTCRSRWDTK
jgi:hypothetical protein